MPSERQIDLYRVAKGLIQKFWVLLLCCLLGGLIGFCWSSYLMTPLYEAKALMYVNNSAISVGNTTLSLSSQDLSAAQSLVDTYEVILNSRNTLEDVIEQKDLPYTYDELKDMIETDAVNSTEVFSITVTSPKPKEAEEIANAIAKILPDKIGDIIEKSSAKVVDYAVVPAVKSSPNIAAYTIAGALIGLILSALGVSIAESRNDQIKSAADLEQRYPDVPVLASVPDLASKKAGYGYYKRDDNNRKKGKRN